MLRILRELFRFVRVHRKIWLIPVLVVLLIMLLLIILALKGGVAAPFIYPLV